MKIKFILASKSPRRIELLKQIGIEPIVSHPHIDESNIALEASKLTEYLAKKKAFSAAEELKEEALVLGVDTIVLRDSQVIGKPQTRNEAFGILSRLQGDRHFVKSSICVYKVPEMNFILKTATSEILFKKLSEPEINSYLDTNEFSDKAGAYAIQGKAAVFIKNVKGSYSNIVGLPLYELGEALAEIGYPIRSFWQ